LLGVVMGMRVIICFIERSLHQGKDSCCAESEDPKPMQVKSPSIDGRRQKQASQASQTECKPQIPAQCVIFMTMTARHFISPFVSMA
jgi:hypothetical protein